MSICRTRSWWRDSGRAPQGRSAGLSGVGDAQCVLRLPGAAVSLDGIFAAQSGEQPDADVTINGSKSQKLRGNRSGQYSIRVSKSWRICFNWIDGDAYEVELNNHYS